jgi:hypothetical protein
VGHKKKEHENSTPHSHRPTHNQNINIRSWKNPTPTRMQYSRHTGENHQKFGNMRHKEHNEKKKERKGYIHTF